MSTGSIYSAVDRERWKKRLLAKGGEIAAKLEEILANKDVSLDDLGLKMVDDDKEPKEKRLRRYFDHIMKRLKVVDDPRFGFDPKEGRFLTVTELDEVPWIDCEP